MTLRSDTHYPTATEGLTNARTKLVGNRTGFVADAVITTVRIGTAIFGERPPAGGTETV